MENTGFLGFSQLYNQLYKCTVEVTVKTNFSNILLWIYTTLFLVHQMNRGLELPFSIKSGPEFIQQKIPKSILESISFLSCYFFFRILRSKIKKEKSEVGRFGNRS
jgi:ribonucleotide reductase beta subunit family protein with ferritin-like domain